MISSYDKKNLVNKLPSAHSIRIICKTLNISRSTIRREVTNTPLKRRKAEMISVIREIYEYSNKVYGAPKIHKELIKTGYQVTLRTVSKYMREADIISIRQKRFKVSRSSDLKQCRINYLKDDVVDIAHSYISIDITYIWTGDGWSYLCSFMDLYTLKILMWCCGQGSQFTSKSFQKIVLNNDAICSYIKKGYDLRGTKS